MGIFNYDWGAQGGIRPALEEIQNQFSWGRRELSVVYGAQISGAARDSGSTPTSVLRPGLAMGIITASKLWAQYDPTATDGTQICRGFLAGPSLRMTDINGSNQNKQAAIIVSGPVLASRLYNLDQLARAHCFGRFIFDDDIVGNSSGWRDVVAKTADYTVTAADNMTIFTNRGAAGTVNFTLPTIALGLRYRFYCEADQTLTITAATADTLVAHNDLAADTVSIAGGVNSKKIGASLEIYANDNASKWLVIPSGWLTADTAGNSGFSLTT